MAEVVYENHLKNAYSVKPEGKRFVITSTSFYQLSEETAWLIGELPDKGSEDLYFTHLASLGLNDPRKIFGRLVTIKVLIEKRRQSMATIFKRITNPKVQILAPKTQEKLISYFIRDIKADISRWILVLSIVSLTGIFWGAFLVLAGTEKAIPALLTGHPNWMQVFLLALASSLVHELGHSFMVAASDIGLRPIGLSIYLVFPAFYTNVSGIEKVSLRQKMLINCGGFLFQGIFLFLLLISASLTGSYLFAEASRWIMVLVLLNLNPFLRTDGYWIYKDLRSRFKVIYWAQAVHILYLAGYIIFSVYFLWRVGASFVSVSDRLTNIINSPSDFLSQGYMAVVWAYFLVMAFIGSLRRFQEIRQEWNEIEL